MKKVNNVEEYLDNHLNFKEGLLLLREIMNSTELAETLKWNAPTYTINGKNVIGLGAFKHHFGIWFFNGVFLKDEQKVLINAQEDKTKGLRQMRFTAAEDIDKSLVKAYVEEAIENQKQGKTIKPKRPSKTVVIAEALNAELITNKELKKKFEGLTPGKQREYSTYISEAKREATKLSRIEKIKPMILDGKGLYDKYKNC